MADRSPRPGPTLREAVSAGAMRLKAAGVETAMLDARLLLFASTGIDAEDYIRDPRRRLEEAEARIFETCLIRRESGEPVSRILGSREFYGRSFRLGKNTLDPRPDTEALIDAVLQNREAIGPAPRILDLGVGSGAILLTLLAEIPGATGIGVDRSPEALKIARANGAALGLSERAVFCCADWHSALADTIFDIVVSNPPYIPSGEIAGLAVEVREHDPALALDGGRDGLDAYREILKDLPRVTRRNAAVFLEIGASQGESVAALVKEAGFVLDGKSWLVRDLAGRPRCVIGKRRVRRSGAGFQQIKKGLGSAAASS